tara:strand:- start:2725 stop:3156 length:432 start_codon:yes stop_codon:yes gene_type:complete
MSTVEAGNTVSVHYRGTLDDGTEFDSSRNSDETLTFEVGSGQMIPGFDAALPGMAVGDVKQITLSPSEAYGEPNMDAIADVTKNSFPEDYEFTVGSKVQGENQDGGVVVGIIEEVHDDKVTIDFNHPLSGQALNFEIELVSIN